MLRNKRTSVCTYTFALCNDVDVDAVDGCVTCHECRTTPRTSQSVTQSVIKRIARLLGVHRVHIQKALDFSNPRLLTGVVVVDVRNACRQILHTVRRPAWDKEYIARPKCDLGSPRACKKGVQSRIAREFVHVWELGSKSASTP